MTWSGILLENLVLLVVAIDRGVYHRRDAFTKEFTFLNQKIPSRFTVFPLFLKNKTDYLLSLANYLDSPNDPTTFVPSALTSKISVLPLTLGSEIANGGTPALVINSQELRDPKGTADVIAGYECSYSDLG